MDQQNNVPNFFKLVAVDPNDPNTRTNQCVAEIEAALKKYNYGIVFSIHWPGANLEVKVVPNPEPPRAEQ
jgi:hypothetical protein